MAGPRRAEQRWPDTRQPQALLFIYVISQPVLWKYIRMKKYIFLSPLIGCLECLATHTSPLIGWRGGWPLPGPPGHTRPPGPLPPAPWLLASPGQEGALLTRPSPVSTAVLDPRPAPARVLYSPVHSWPQCPEGDIRPEAILSRAFGSSCTTMHHQVTLCKGPE